MTVRRRPVATAPTDPLDVEPPARFTYDAPPYYAPELDPPPPVWWTDGLHMWRLLRACQRWSDARLKWSVPHGLNLPLPGMRDQYVAAALKPRADLYPGPPERPQERPDGSESHWKQDERPNLEGSSARTNALTD